MTGAQVCYLLLDQINSLLITNAIYNARLTFLFRFLVLDFNFIPENILRNARSVIGVKHPPISVGFKKFYTAPVL